MNKKNILCAIDFSESSLQALQWTMGMAQLTKSQVTVLFCYRLISQQGDEEIAYLKRKTEADALKRFKALEKESTGWKPVPYEFVTEVGFFPSRIELALRKNPANLLVLGNSIIADFNEYKNLTFEQFLMTAKVPVVVVPEFSGRLVA